MPIESKTLAEEWESFKRAIPKDAPDVQFHEMRGAFYAGAASMNMLHMKAMDCEPFEKSLAKFNALKEELRLFLAEKLKAAGFQGGFFQ
jgi:hypothetical protein